MSENELFKKKIKEILIVASIISATIGLILGIRLSLRPINLTFSIGIITAFLGVLYVNEIQSEDKGSKKIQSEYYNNIKDAVKTGCKSRLEKIFLKDYDTTNKEIERRENITLIIGTIFVVSSFLILGQTIANINTVKLEVASFASIIIYFIWLIPMHFTTRKYDTMSYARSRAIEEYFRKEYGVEFGIHTFLNARRPKYWWRTAFWAWPLIALGLCWTLLS